MSVKAMTWVLDWSESTGATRLVALALASHADKDGQNAWPSYSTLASKAKVDRRTVPRALTELQEMGDIERQGESPKGTGIYGFPMRRGSGKTPLVATRHGGEVPSGDTPGGVVARDDTGSGVVPPDPSLTVLDPSLQRQLFDFWKESFGLNGRTQFTSLRKAKLTARLKDSTPDEIRTAITAVAASSWHRENGKFDLELICRSRTQLEKYLALAARGPVKPEDDNY